MKKGDKVNTTCVEGTFTLQGFDSKGRAMLKKRNMSIIVVPANTVHPAGTVVFKDKKAILV